MTGKVGEDQIAAAHRAAETLLDATLTGLEVLRSKWSSSPVADFTDAITRSAGRVVVCGMGKSGLIAQKIAATFASTGCPSLFLHPAEAVHGDLGMVTADDIAILLSNSGETAEIIALVPSLIRMQVPIAAITSNPRSRLAQAARWCFAYDLPNGEGCPLNFAPMASTTQQLVWGDLLNAYRMAYTRFNLEHYARLHPAGNIGARLLKTGDLMHAEFPILGHDAPLVQVVGAMSRGRLGMAVVTLEDQGYGVVSDGDIRRALERAESAGLNPLALKAGDIGTRNPVSVSRDCSAVEAARVMEHRKITFVIVEDGTGLPVGVLHIHDLLQAKVI